MKIGIIGTRGIPNQYGGFEQFAEHFSTRMCEKGHDVYVYTSHNHPHKSSFYKNVRLIKCFDPERYLGTIGQFIYDFNCIKDSRKHNFDIILQLGYTSSTIWSWLYPKSAALVTNMDGLEWSRAKYNKLTQRFLRYAEKWGVKYSQYLIADSKGIQEYLQKKYEVHAELVPYGAGLYDDIDTDTGILEQYGIAPQGYDLVIARFEPENNVEMVLKAYAQLEKYKLVLIGNYMRSAFGRRLYAEYGNCTNIKFLGSIFDTAQLNVLRFYSRIYVHGHTVGGTNPSLLEAMGCNTLICAHNNLFNKYVLEDDAFYFRNQDELMAVVTAAINATETDKWKGNNKKKVVEKYNWDIITQTFETFFLKWKNEKNFCRPLAVIQSKLR